MTVADYVFYLSILALTAGLAGSVGLALLTRGYIRINPDGTQSWGQPPGVSNDQWLRRNRRLRKLQSVGIPLAYGGLGLAFVTQLLALVLQRVA